MIEKFLTFFTSYSTIFSLNSKALGLFLCLVTLLAPNTAIAGLFGLFFCVIFLKLLGISHQNFLAQSSLRNSLLIGLLVGNLLSLNFSILLFLIIFIIVTIFVTTALEHLFSKEYLPVFSLPFCIIGLMIFILLPHLLKFSQPPSALWIINIKALLPNFLVLFFHSLSSILCITDPTIGLLIWIAVAFFSPLTALFLVSGFFIGTSFEGLFHNVSQDLSLYSEGYNYSLIFTALAGFFLTPSRFSILMATLATIATSLIVVVSSAMLNWWYLPILSLPFNIVLITSLLSLKHLRPSALTTIFCQSPEQHIEVFTLAKNRHRFGEIGIFLPTKGTWQIQQGFDGKLTHRGPWRHGLDFVAVNEQGQIFSNQGLELQDHFSFGQDIFSPIDGQIVSCLDGENDNLIGQVINGRNWGNYLIIKSAAGFYVTLAHLQKDSLLVRSQEFVKAGQKLAKCGNSGYSQEPHLHLQVQYQKEIGSATAPFHLMNYAIGNQIYFNRTPLENEILRDLNFNHASAKVLNFRIGQKMIFERSDKTQVTITNQVDEISGSFYLTDGIAKIYYNQIGSQFYFYGLSGKKSALHDLMAAAPRIPLIYGAEISYCDDLPRILTQKNYQHFYSQFLQICGLAVKNSQGKYRLNKQGLEISGSHKFMNREVRTICKIDPALGIQEFSVGDRKYTKIA